MKLRIVPVELKKANEFVRAFHRHHHPTISHKFSIGVVDETGLIRGVAIVGLPKARMLMDGWTLEVNRVCTDGCPNACSALYGAAWRIARNMGFSRLVTYILDAETGVSLKASGWQRDGDAGGGSWQRPNLPARRASKDNHPTDLKTRWSVMASADTVSVRWPIETAEPSSQEVLAI